MRHQTSRGRPSPANPRRIPRSAPSIRYTERLAAEHAVTSVGSKGDSYDNTMAESINSLYKGECIRREGPWRTVDYVELATLSWVHWWNTRRILEPIGEIPPIEFEATYDRDRQAPSRKIAAPALATTGSLRSNLSNTVELDNAPRTEPTFPTAVTNASPKTE